ncbi:hypothetical protein HY311_01235 [Candidatus Nomurabacteria bacterium]|nr:hypothetical protein [Candidatus Nomurabacteria bacterium]
MKYKKFVFLLSFVLLVLFAVPGLSRATDCAVTATCGGGNADTRDADFAAGGFVANMSACQTIIGSPLASMLQTEEELTRISPFPPENGGPRPVFHYNPGQYSTLAASDLLASCLGGTAIVRVLADASSPFDIPAEPDVIFKGLTFDSAEYITLLNSLGNVREWYYAWIQPGISTTSPATGSSTPSTPLPVSSSSSSTSTSASTSAQSSSDKAMAALNAQVKQAQEKYLNQISQVINAVGSTVPCGTNICPDLQQLINLQTQLYQTGSVYSKPIFTTNANGSMRVGDIWSVAITGLNPGEIIYGTGGRKTGSVVPTDKTPYTANGLGVFFETGTHTKEVVGDWQIVWTRANGTVLGTMTFSVANRVVAGVPVSGTTSGNRVELPTTISCRLTATCSRGDNAPTSSPVPGTKTSNFDYMFTKNGDAWVITLDNVALGTPADHFYIPASYSITALGAYDLNMQAQSRFNTGSYFPGTPDGNTFYSQMFGAFIAAYYDWDNKTGTNSSSNATQTADVLTANDSTLATVKVGDTIKYVWNSVGGTSYDSYYMADKPDTCVGGFTSAGTTKPWVANSAKGSVSETALSCQVGVTYTIAYRVHNAIGSDSLKSVIVVVKDASGATGACGITGTCATY